MNNIGKTNPDSFIKAHAEARAIDEAAEKLGYSKKLIDARARRITDEVYEENSEEEATTNAGLKSTLEEAEKKVRAKVKYIEEQIKGFIGGVPLVDITTEEFEYYAALHGRNVIDWTDTKYGGDYRLLDLGNYNDTHKLVLKQEPDRKFRLGLFPIARWNYEVINIKEAEDDQKLNQALEGEKIPKELRKIED